MTMFEIVLLGLLAFFIPIIVVNYILTRRLKKTFSKLTNEDWEKLYEEMEEDGWTRYDLGNRVELRKGNSLLTVTTIDKKP